MNTPPTNTILCRWKSVCRTPELIFNGDDSDDFETELTTARTMKDEGRRLLTFEKWPPCSCQHPASLAEAGFFYTSSGDRVKCAFCLGVLKTWQPDDVPFLEHKKHFPYCRFIKGEEVGNIPLRQIGIEQVLEMNKREEPELTEPVELTCEMTFTQDETRRQNYKIEPSITGNTKTSAPLRSNLVGDKGLPMCNKSCTPTSTNQNYNRTTAITPSECRPRAKQVNLSKPKVSATDYTFEANRLATFLRWPVDSPLQPEDVARAGFYFVPTEAKPDRVKCGYCGGKLYGWQQGDDPMVEHSRCFPECPYIKLCVGGNRTKSGGETKYPSNSSDRASQESVEKVENKRSDILVAPVATKLKGASLDDASSQYLDIATNRTDDDVTVTMRSSTVQAVIAMGFPREKVTQSVRKLIQNGDNGLTVNQLLNTLL